MGGRAGGEGREETGDTAGGGGEDRIGGREREREREAGGGGE